MAQCAYEITIQGYGPRLVRAKSAAAARYDRWLEVSDVWNITFGEFLQISKVRAVALPPAPARHLAMTDAARELGRHALGLDGQRWRSYRNRFVTGAGGSDHAAWTEMVAVGLAEKRDGSAIPFGGNDLFWLTHAGALSCLEPGESLGGEDFPIERAA